MIHILFLTMLYCGFVQEFNTIRNTTTSNNTSLVYALGAVFFLFWRETYIVHGMIVLLGLLSTINFLLEKDTKFYRAFTKIDPYISLLALVGLSIHYIRYLVE